MGKVTTKERIRRLNAEAEKMEKEFMTSEEITAEIEKDLFIRDRVTNYIIPIVFSLIMFFGIVKQVWLIAGGFFLLLIFQIAWQIGKTKEKEKEEKRRKRI